MSELPSREEIDAAESYESLYVPALFQQWAPRLLDAAGVGPGQRVLDVACGTGVLAREAAARVGENGHVTGVDPGPGMLAVARRRSPGIQWKAAAAESLPFPDGTFDGVLSQFGLMYFDDREGSVREMLRVASPGGRLALAVWDSLENSGAYPIVVDLLQRMAGQEAADAVRAPFALGDTGALADMFASAGAASVDVATLSGTARFPGVRTMVEAELRGWLPVMGVHLEDDHIERILEAAETELQQYVTERGEIVFDAPAHIVTAAKA